MDNTFEVDEKIKDTLEKVKPLCPVFGECGGCVYQDIRYADELHIKEETIKSHFKQELGLVDNVFSPIVPSPKEYFYRHRLDISFRKTMAGQYLLGFKPPKRKRTVEVESCVIGREEISDFIPQLKEDAIKGLPENYRVANLVVKTGDDKRVVWGGMGRRSLQMDPKEYLYTEIHGKRIYYSLDTFFQANLEILPDLMNMIKKLDLFDQGSVFFDLYSGVGLFGFYFADQVEAVALVEESATSNRVARYNLEAHKLKGKVDIRQEKVETALPLLLEKFKDKKKVALIDPPRKGLTDETIKTLIDSKDLNAILYLSCGPKSLARDLKKFQDQGWQVEKIIPFDFFPKTIHVETLAVLKVN